MVADPTSYAQADQILSETRGAGRGQRRMLARNTYLTRRSDTRIAVRLHQTDIVIFHERGVIEVYTGGWNTMTTRERINRYLPSGYAVWTDKRVAYLSRRPWDSEGFRYPLTEGVMIDPSRGAIIDGPEQTPEADRRGRGFNAYWAGGGYEAPMIIREGYEAPMIIQNRSAEHWEDQLLDPGAGELIEFEQANSRVPHDSGEGSVYHDKNYQNDDLRAYLRDRWAEINN